MVKWWWGPHDTDEGSPRFALQGKMVSPYEEWRQSRLALRSYPGRPASDSGVRVSKRKEVTADTHTWRGSLGSTEGA